MWWKHVPFIESVYLIYAFCCTESFERFPVFSQQLVCFRSPAPVRAGSFFGHFDFAPPADSAGSNEMEPNSLWALMTERKGGALR